MKKEVVILIAEDDEGHAGLIKANLARGGIVNEMIHFMDGQAVLDFLFRNGAGPHRAEGTSYVLLLDIRMPKVDGVEVLAQLKADRALSKIPIIMVTTTDDPREVDRCHALGCNNYVTKPVEYEQFVHAVKQLGFFLAIMEIPNIDGESA